MLTYLICPSAQNFFKMSENKNLFPANFRLYRTLQVLVYETGLTGKL